MVKQLQSVITEYPYDVCDPFIRNNDVATKRKKCKSKTN